MPYNSIIICCCRRINNNDESIENSTPDGNADNLPRAESICACGHIKSVHSKKALGAAPSYSTSKSWTVEKDTALSDTATDAYGKIEFDETEEYRPFNKPTLKRVGQSFSPFIIQHLSDLFCP